MRTINERVRQMGGPCWHCWCYIPRRSLDSCLSWPELSLHSTRAGISWLIHSEELTGGLGFHLGTEWVFYGIADVRHSWLFANTFTITILGFSGQTLKFSQVSFSPPFYDHRLNWLDSSKHSGWSLVSKGHCHIKSCKVATDSNANFPIVLQLKTLQGIFNAVLISRDLYRSHGCSYLVHKVGRSSNVWIWRAK